MRKVFCSWLCLLAFAATDVRSATVVVTNLGDAAGTCPSSASCTLRAAIAAALPDDRIEFDGALPFPADLSLSGTELAINKNLTIAGPGADRLSVRAAPNRRVLAVTAGSVIIERLELAGGRQFGINGPSGSPGSGTGGVSGGVAEGGCVRTSAGTSLVLDRASIRDCIAQGGSAGSGGSGASGNPPGNGGPGGAGGLARGGAIAVDGQLTLVSASISGALSVGGPGGAGGTGGAGSIFASREGTGGNGGAGGAAQGGAIHVGSGGALLLRNSTLAGNSVGAGNGGNGGAGGDGAAIIGSGAGGNGGIGANAHGGQVHLNTSVALADVEFSSLGPAGMTSGNGGIGGPGDPNGFSGVSGSRSGENLFASSVPRIRSSLLVGNNAAVDCFGAVTASGANADSDNSCAGFTLQGNFSANFRGPAIDVEGGRAVIVPLPGSLSIDSAVDCTDLAGAAVISDQSGRVRPLDGDGNGSALCDPGAVEFSNALFANGFE